MQPRPRFQERAADRLRRQPAELRRSLAGLRRSLRRLRRPPAGRGARVLRGVPRWRLVRVAGDSMRPTLRPGDVLLLSVGARPRVGGLVVADLPGGRGPAVKRAVRREPGGWWLERDSSTVGTDSWLFGAVADGDVRGVVRARLWPRPGLLRGTGPRPRPR